MFSDFQDVNKSIEIREGLFMEWNFPSNNHGEVKGISDSGVETFQGTPLKSLAREICQNSLDAAIKNQTVQIEFKGYSIPRSSFPDADGLVNAFRASSDFWKIQKSRTTTDFFDRALMMINSSDIPFLRISDFNTTGLKGSRVEYNSPWSNLTKSSGASDKAGTAGGSFGIGKFAPFACSEFRTVFYSTLDDEFVTASQGISRITSYKNSNNEVTAGTGYWGANNNQPLPEQLQLDPNFERGEKEFGTDIFITGFRFLQTDWKENVIASVLDGFLYAIYSEKLIVIVDDITIDKDSLADLIKDYQSSVSENADKYFRVLTSSDTKWFKVNYKNNGLIKLGLLIQSDQDDIMLHRKVAMIRKTGMKILDRGNISGNIPFAGIMLIEGEQVNNYLRNLENPQHTKWEPDRIEPKSNIPYAKKYITDLNEYIKTCLEELVQSNNVEEIDPDVGEFLPDESQIDFENNNQQVESLSEEIKSIEISTPPPRKLVQQESTEQEIEVAKKSSFEDETDSEFYDSGAGNSNGKESQGGFGYGELEGDGVGPNPKPYKYSVINVEASKIRVVCINKNAGEYSISFTPTMDASNGTIELAMVSESAAYPAPILEAEGFKQPQLNVYKNQISGIRFIANNPVRIKTKIDFYDYCSMEVKAYGHSV